MHHLATFWSRSIYYMKQQPQNSQEIYDIENLRISVFSLSNEDCYLKKKGLDGNVLLACFFSLLMIMTQCSRRQ